MSSVEENVKAELGAIGALVQSGQLDEAGMRSRLGRVGEMVKEEWGSNVSPLGSIPGLAGTLLDERRVEYSIPDCVFDVSPAYDRIFVWQIDRNRGETALEGGVIIRPDVVRERDKQSCPMGIVVGAGLKARDVLASNGIDLGHVVVFLRLSPYRVVLGNIASIEVSVLVMRDGDLVGSRDIAQQLLSGEKQLDIKNNDGVIEHRWADGVQPQSGMIGGDY